uniref:Uncharacterized protein n=1 Tax=Lactuca sativa TaxID=4236 RepID=A0A9R1WHP4_LACSA|nr:hypothetical protein LSAT_V11C100018030 [Lactuca sativa]
MEYLLVLFPWKIVTKKEDLLKKRPSKKTKKKKVVVEETSKKKTEKWPLVLHVDTSIFALFLIVLMGAFYVVTILSSIKVGLHVFDDFREAYAWLSHNTEVDDKLIIQHGTTHIATVGTAMSSPKKAA